MLHRLLLRILRLISIAGVHVTGYGIFQRIKKQGASTRAPHELSGAEWRMAAKETWHALFDKKLLTLAGGVAFFASLAVLPALAGGAALLSIFVSPNESAQTIATLSSYLPKEFATSFEKQISSLAASNSTNITAAAVAFIIGVWAGSTAIDNLIQTLNSVYNVKETRSFLRLKITSLILMLVVAINFALTIPLLLISSEGLRSSDIAPWLVDIFPIVRWICVLFIVGNSVALIYRYGPNRSTTHWQWTSWGASTASLLWLVGTSLFFLYVQYIADFSQVYGLLAGLFVLMIWIQMGCFIVILGAQINDRLEHQAKSQGTQHA